MSENSDVTPSAGTLEYAIGALQEYCSELENRVVERFDECTNAVNRPGMEECAKIMAKLDKEVVLAKVVSKKNFTSVASAGGEVEVHLFETDVH